MINFKVYHIKKYSMKNLFYLSIVILLIACGKEDAVKDSDTFIFGHFFGECIGELCVEIYKIENDKLYEDTNDQYPSINGNTYSWVERDDVDIQEIEDILLDVPEKLFEETDQIIGMPDAGDWGGIYVKLIREDETFFWLIDHADENIPSYLVDFTTSIKNSIVVLKE
jgi:hypothetical protein